MNKVDYPGGPIRDIERFSSVPLMLAASASRFGSQIFMKETDSSGSPIEISFAELRSRAEAFARELLQTGPSPVVAVSGRNSIDWAVAFLGTLCAGGIVVPIDKELPSSDISGILHYSGATVFVFDVTLESAVQEHKATGRSVCSHHYVMNTYSSSLFPTLSSMVAAGDSLSTSLPSVTSSSDIAVISYTSGTMGAAKGVVLSHGNLLSDLQMMLATANIATDEVFLSVLPFHHMYECVCGFLCPLQHGCTIVISRGLRYIVEDLASNGVTIVLGVPLLWEGMYRRIIEQVKSIRGGALKFAFGKAVSGAADMLGARSVRSRIFSKVHNRFGGSLKTLVSGGAALDMEGTAGIRPH